VYRTSIYGRLSAPAAARAARVRFVRPQSLSALTRRLAWEGSGGLSAAALERGHISEHLIGGGPVPRSSPLDARLGKTAAEAAAEAAAASVASTATRVTRAGGNGGPTGNKGRGIAAAAVLGPRPEGSRALDRKKALAAERDAQAKPRPVSADIMGPKAGR